MKEILSLVLPARLENLQAFMEAAREAAAAAGLPSDGIFRLEIALEEALVNIMHYAYKGNTGEIQVVCRSCDRRLFVTEITDTGNPFDVTAVPPPDLVSGVDERRIGGLGIHLMKTLIDEVSYRRERESNVLVLRMSLAFPDTKDQSQE
jgi:serine/threonine-protein kinase RsbW